MYKTREKKEDTRKLVAWDRTTHFSICDCEMPVKHTLILSENTQLIREMKRSFRTVHSPTSIRSRSAVYRTLSSPRPSTWKVMNKVRV